MAVTDWSVYLEAVAPEGESRDAEEMAELAVGLLPVLTDAGAAGAVPSAGARSWSVLLSVDCPDARQAAYLAESIIITSAKKTGLPMWPIARLEAVRRDVLDAELAVPNFPDLVGTQEATEMLGVSRQRLHELRSAGRFPEPMVTLAAGPVWLRSTIEAFLEGWNRKPGRPSGALGS